MRICYRHDIGSVQLILREARTAFQGTDSPNISLFFHCDDQLTIFVNFSCYAHSKFWFIGNPRKNKCPKRIRNRAIRGLNSLDSKAQSQIQWRGSMSSLIDDLSYWAVPCNGVLTVQHIKRLEFRLCHMWHCSWIMAVRVGHCRKSTQLNFKSNECVEILVGKYARHVHRIIFHSFIENVLDKAVFNVHEITFSIQSNGFLCNQPLFYSLSFKVYHSTTSI